MASQHLLLQCLANTLAFFFQVITLSTTIYCSEVILISGLAENTLRAAVNS